MNQFFGKILLTRLYGQDLLEQDILDNSFSTRLFPCFDDVFSTRFFGQVILDA